MWIIKIYIVRCENFWFGDFNKFYKHQMKFILLWLLKCYYSPVYFPFFSLFVYLWKGKLKAKNLIVRKTFRKNLIERETKRINKKIIYIFTITISLEYALLSKTIYEI